MLVRFHASLALPNVFLSRLIHHFSAAVRTSQVHKFFFVENDFSEPADFAKFRSVLIHRKRFILQLFNKHNVVLVKIVLILVGIVVGRSFIVKATPCYRLKV